MTRPIAELTDSEHADFNEVFFTDVEVPAENLVGELHHGWSVAGGSLAHERGMLWINEATGIERILERVVDDRHHPAARRPAPRRRPRPSAPRWPGPTCRPRPCKLLGYRGFAKFAKGEASPSTRCSSSSGSELRRDLALDVGEALGATGTRPRPPRGAVGGPG